MIRFLVYCLLILFALSAGAAENAFFVELVAETDHAVLAHRDGSILLLGLPDLETVGRLGDGASGPLEGVAVSASGRWLAADSRKEGLRIWDLASGDLRMTVPRAAPDTAPIFLFDTRRDLLYLFQGEELQLWDPALGVRAGTVGPIRGVRKMSISPDGLFLAVAGWCHTGCGDFDLCLYGLDEELVLAAASFDFLLGEAVTHEIHDLAYMDDNRIVIESTVPGEGPDPIARILPATLRVPGVAAWGSAQGEWYPGIRSAPRTQHQHTSPNALWKIRLSPERKRLYLYRREAADDPDSEFELEKFVRLP